MLLKLLKISNFTSERVVVPVIVESFSYLPYCLDLFLSGNFIDNNSSLANK